MSSLPPHLNCLSKLSTVTWWNSNIRDAVNQGHAYKALVLFRQMKLNGLQPNNFTFPFLGKACAKLSHLIDSQIIHTHVVKSPFHSNIFVQTAMVDMYVKCGKVEDAYNLFDKMPVRDIASWNAMIIGFSQSDSLDRVFSLFVGMRLVGIRPDAATVIGLTRAVLSAKSLRFLTVVHAVGIETGLDADISVANTWIAGYSKCGDLQLAKMVFHGIQKHVREGTYGKVYRTREKATDKIVALKKTRLHEDEEGVPPTTLIEVSILQMLSRDPHIIRLMDVKQGQNKEGKSFFTWCLNKWILI